MEEEKEEDELNQDIVNMCLLRVVLVFFQRVSATGTRGTGGERRRAQVERRCGGAEVTETPSKPSSGVGHPTTH